MTGAAASTRYALITGGNRGIGLEVVKQLVQRGKPVLLACRDVEAGKVAAESLLQETKSSSSSGCEVKCLSLDTASTASITKLAELVKRDYDQKIDLLVNNAGILMTKVWSEDAYNKTVAVNSVGPVAVSEAVLPLLAPGALIVMVSSGLGRAVYLTADYKQAVQTVQAVNNLSSMDKLSTAVPFNLDSPMGTSAPEKGSFSPTYSVAKALLNRSVQLMSADERYKQRGVSVVSVCPGWCRTDMGDSVIASSGAADRSAAQGASSVLWPYLNWSDKLNGGFTRDGGSLDW